MPASDGSGRLSGKRPQKHSPALFVFFFLSLVAFFIQPHEAAYAEPVIRIDAGAQYDFAEHYFKKGDYSRAVDEYKRFIYFFPEDDRTIQAMHQIGMAFYMDRRYAEAVTAFNEVIDKFTLGEWSVRSYFMLSESYLRLNRYDSAVITLHNLIALSDSRDVTDKANYRLGWIYIESASWDNARIYFEKISTPHRESFRLERLSTELAQAAVIPAKSPALAGILSIVPGAGQVYCGRYQDALIAFLLNGVLMFATYEAFDNDNNALGALLGFIEVGFYSGNIYGAVGSAHKYNRSRTRQFIENLKKNTKIDLSGNPESESIRLSLRFTF